MVTPHARRSGTCEGYLFNLGSGALLRWLHHFTHLQARSCFGLLQSKCTVARRGETRAVRLVDTVQWCNLVACETYSVRGWLATGQRRLGSHGEVYNDHIRVR